MASRPVGYGYTSEMQSKMKGRYSADHEKEIVDWLQSRTGMRMTGQGSDAFREYLIDGQVLCKLFDSFGLREFQYKVKPISSKAGRSDFQKMENIGIFLKTAEKFGVKKADLFQTADLYDNTNMAQVQSAMFAVGSEQKNRGISGASIGTVQSKKNQRHFTEEQHRAGSNVIGLQMGHNKGATQAGMTGYGQGRQIIHKSK